MAESLKKRTVNGLKWSAIDRFSSSGIQFVMQIILARLLLPRDYGIIAMLTIFIAISQTFVDSGFSQALIRKLDRNEDDYTTAFLFNIVVGVVVYGLLYLGSPFIASFYNTPLLASITKLIALSVLLNSLCVVQQAILTIKLDFKTQTYISLFSVIFSGGIAIYLASKGYGAWALAWQVVIAAFLRSALLWLLVGWKPKGRFSRKSFKSLFGFGSKLLASGLLDTIYNNIYLIVIGKLYSSQLLGLYSKAKGLAVYPASFISAITQRVTYPVLSGIQDDDARLHTNYRKLIRLTAFLVFPLMIGLAAVADPLVRLLLTDKWEGCILLLQILCFSQMWYPLDVINVTFLNVKGRSDLFLRLEIYKKMLSTIILLGTLPFGVMALCIGQVVNLFIYLIIDSYYTGKFIKLGFWIQMKDILPTLVISVIMLGGILAVNSFVNSIALKLIVDIAVGAIIFVGLSYLRKAEELAEIISMIRRK